MNLISAKTNKKYIVVATPENLLLENLGVFENQKIKVKHKYPFSGPVVIEINHRNIAIANPIAKTITLRER